VLYLAFLVGDILEGEVLARDLGLRHVVGVRIVVVHQLVAVRTTEREIIKSKHTISPLVNLYDVYVSS
jgi:hypothetical protein